MSITQASKDRAVRDHWRGLARRWTATAEKLVSHGAPAIVVEDARQRAHAFKLRSWGWTGPVPRRSTEETP